MEAPHTVEKHIPKQTAREAPAPSLFDLPAELRNHIYRYALTESHELVISDSAPPQQPALTRTCRQIRTEALGIFYLNNGFRCHVDNLDSSLMRRWWGRREIDSYKDDLIVRSQFSFDGGPC
ncbi:hypothetical protein LTS18_011639 [Coniosporium uncinatum]|uniref:Uncharacterized protein n=1 Tax=Coniosporium uncinatum TaxID=93489 RepID=A0ACC3D9I9_9PEZI|nr:hypothetical protein LTS18_011639 [Coniosporium uncinatum]